jgi:hypothetical protein
LKSKAQPKPKPPKKPLPPKPLNIDERFVLRMTLDRPVSWAQIYNRSVDKLLKYGLITWKHNDERGPFYSTIIATDEGKKAYSSLTWGRIEDGD